MKVLLLPGMDGTGELFGPLLQHLAPELEPEVVSYPRERPLGYEELLSEIPVPAAPFAVVAESFSGPLAVRIAARHPELTRALVLVATFARCPAPVLARLAILIAPLVFRGPPPASLLRWALLGRDATGSEVLAVQEVLRSVPSRTLDRRLRAIVEVDVSRELGEVRAPTLYIAGTRDRLVGAKASRQLRALRPDVEVCRLDSPHFVLQRKPAEAAAAISRHLRQLD